MPDPLVDVVLGLVQGLTEFLPISSSGHLVVLPAAFGWDEPSVSFDLFLHVGTLLAVLVYFRRDLGQIALGLAGRGADPTGTRRLAWLLVVGTLPAAFAGLVFEDFFESLFERALWVCLFWVVTAAILVLPERFRSGPGAPERSGGLDLRVALLVGTAQAAAIVPGISRSGSTIAMGLALGLSRTESARFSFLLSIPAIGGGGLTLIPEVLDGSLHLTSSVLAGFAAAALSGYVAVAGMLRLLRTRSMAPFSIYLLVVAPAAALWLILT